MKIFVTGGTGFVGSELISQLLGEGHKLRLWHRNVTPAAPLLKLKQQQGSRIELVCGQLGEGREAEAVQGCNAVVHAALWREDRSFQQTPKNLLNSPIEDSKWFDLIANVVAGKPVHPTGGGKEVHVSDVAKAIRVLLAAPAEKVAGEAFSCCDAFYSHRDVASLAKRVAASPADILGSQKSPKHQIETKKIRALGMKFSGMRTFERTVTDICEHLMR